MIFWYLLNRRAVKAQESLFNWTVSPLLLSHTMYGSTLDEISDQRLDQ